MAAGYKDFTASSVLAAADLEDYCENQSIMRFADATARDTALSVVKTEGMMAYLISTNTVTVYSGSAWSTVGPVHGSLTAWTPAIVQSGSVTCTVTNGTYIRTGRWVQGYYNLAVTGTGTGANQVTVTIPVTAQAGVGTILGMGRIFDNSTGFDYHGLLVLASTGTVKYEVINVASPSGTAPGYHGVVNFTAALASGDGVHGQFSYEAAADA